MKARRQQKPRPPDKRMTNFCGFSFVDGAFVEITGSVAEEYLVQFEDTRTGQVIHQDVIKNNCWVRTARQYFTPWQVNVYRRKDKKLLFSHHYNCRNQRVYVALESKALGDSLAWFQVMEDFRIQHNCELICSTFMNDLFREQYPEIQFVEPGEPVHNLYAMYRIGWFYLENGEIDCNKNVKDFRLQPLGETAADILGLPYIPVRPKLKIIELGKQLATDYVCIAVHSTTQAKYWNNPDGWTKVVAFLRQKGYPVVLLSREGMDYMGNQAPADVIWLPPGDITVVINYLRHAKLFIGIGSGLSWLAWAVGCNTCLISGFSEPYTEVDGLIRIAAPPGSCSGCFNRYRLDAGDWHWCPEHKDTPRMFECTRLITAEQVITAIAPHLD